MATVPVKHYFSSDEGAPTIGNSVGDLVGFLDIILNLGFNQKTVSSIVRTGSTVRVTLTSTHLNRVNTVQRLSSNIDQPEYAGDQRIIAVGSNWYEFTCVGTPTTPGTATGAITSKVSPLGFEIYKTATNQRVYRSTNVLSSKVCLRVDSRQLSGYPATGAKFGRVEIAQDYSDIDTSIGAVAPYDPVNPDYGRAITNGNYHGWYKWYTTWGSVLGGNSYSESTADVAGSRVWDVIGDDRGFYLWVRPFGGGISNGFNNTAPQYAFMEFESLRPGDNMNAFLVASDAYCSITVNPPGFTFGPGNASTANNYHNAVESKALLRDHTLIGSYARFGYAGLHTGGGGLSGVDSGIAWPNGPGLSLLLHPISLRQENAHLRAKVVPGMYAIHNNIGGGIFHRTVIDGVDSYPSKKFLILSQARGLYAQSYATEEGRIAFDLLGPWR